MSIGEFLIKKGYGKNIHELKKKLYKTGTVSKIGLEFLVNGKKITDINYQLKNSDVLCFLHNGMHKYIIE